ncbi:phosphoenolpyruvate carboxylase [Candidatus Saccharibacteria bacterium]|nr:phosphoenolpyruvate carboxylase [Candidatus Saccharibacteria bacterium]
MATQHPDNANAPKWKSDGQPFIGLYDELYEALESFINLDIPEFMWDWEGKHADSAVVDKLLSNYHSYFAKHKLGKDRYLTFRIPNIWQEKGYSLLQAMTVILTSEDYARDLKFGQRPLFEVILPMTSSAKQLMHMHELFGQLANFKSEVFNGSHKNNDQLELIPLVESVASQQTIGQLLNEYLKLYKSKFGKSPAYIRPFLARSDPALVSGLIATVLANKTGLSQVYEFSKRWHIAVYPIAGVGSLPFRGGLSPSSASSYAAQYPGLRTVTIQSSFRYDHSTAEVKRAIKTLAQDLPRSKPHIITGADQKLLDRIIHKASELYRSTLKDIIKDMEPLFEAVPRRRERRQHIGLLAYSRSAGPLHLPRAITFTAAFYSLGVPPELIGSGRLLESLSGAQLDLLLRHYPTLPSDLQKAGHYFSQNNLAVLAKRNKSWQQLSQDVKAIERILGIRLGPRTNDEISHVNLSANVFPTKKNPRKLSALIDELAQLRRSLG